MNMIEIAQAVGRDAHLQYLATCEIKTQVAENDGEWTPKIQAQVLENMERISNSLSLLARNLSRHFDIERQKNL